MAVIKKDGNSMGLPMNITRGNPIPLDSSAVYYSYEEAAAYAQSNPIAYVGQLIAVVNESSNDSDVYVIADIAGTLKEISNEEGILPVFITDPQANQVLFFDSTIGKWVNKNLTDDNSIIYLDDTTKGLAIKGYKEALQGYMLVKDSTQGIAWVKPVDTTTLEQYVQQAQSSATQAGTYAVQAGNSAIEAVEAKQGAEAAQTAVEAKMWYGSMEQYNALTTINPTTFYFILDGEIKNE